MKAFLASTITILSALLLLTPSASLADLATTSAPVMSSWEQNTGGNLSRDCGYSAKLSTTADLWVFCDTAAYNSSGTLIGFIAGSTAATDTPVKGRLPQAVTELPSDTPHQFIASPTNLATPTGAACTPANGAYAAAWPSGATHIPSTSKALITYNEYCVALNGSYMTFEGYGVATYTPGATLPLAGHPVFTWAPGTAPLSPARTLGSPIYSGSYINFYAAHCTSKDAYGDCLASDVYLARVPVGKYTRASYYRWLTADGTWSSSPSKATNIIPGSTALAVNTAVTSHGVAVVAQNNIGGGYTVWTSPKFGSGFVATSTGTVPCATTSGGVGGFCRAIIPHPELSDSTQLTLTWFNPSAHTTGHVVAGQLLW